MNISAEQATGRGLVPDDLFTRLANRIVKERRMSHDLAERIVDQALAFLATCARTAEPLSPSDTIDIGWHTFILYTREYAEFCTRIAGHFIHHEPTDTGKIAITRTPVETVRITVAALRKAGFATDLPLWAVSAKCHQCSEGCTHSGGDTGCHHVRPLAATVRA